MQPKLSVIIPVYRVEKYLDACVRSVLNQAFHDIEIILVDDESPDTCPQICDKYASEYSNVKVIHKKNGGLGFARNSGLEVATGEYVAFLDSDDYVEHNAIEILLSEAIQCKTDVVIAGTAAGSKLDKAQELNILIWDEEMFASKIKTH